MAKNKRKNQKDDELLVDIVDAQEQALDFFEKNQTKIIGGLLAFVIIVGGYFGYKNLYKLPQEKEAMEQMYKAEYMFRLDSLDKALNSAGEGFPGFLGIIEDYGSTKAGNLANYYAGAIYLQKGEFDNAVKYLKAYSADGRVTPATTNGMLGDALSELGKLDDAIGYYNKAANSASDEFTAPYYLFKSGLLLKKQGKNDEAQKNFKKIKEEYPTSIQGQDIDKYLAEG